MFTPPFCVPTGCLLPLLVGQGTIVVGIVSFLLPLGEYAALAGLILIGLGCAPIYPGGHAD